MDVNNQVKNMVKKSPMKNKIKINPPAAISSKRPTQ